MINKNKRRITDCGIIMEGNERVGYVPRWQDRLLLTKCYEHQQAYFKTQIKRNKWVLFIVGLFHILFTIFLLIPYAIFFIV